MKDEQWETICVTANEIQSYSVTGNQSRKSTLFLITPYLIDVLNSREAHKAHFEVTSVRSGSRGCSGRIKSYYPL